MEDEAFHLYVWHMGEIIDHIVLDGNVFYNIESLVRVPSF